MTLHLNDRRHTVQKQQLLFVAAAEQMTLMMNQFSKLWAFLLIDYQLTDC